MSDIQSKVGDDYTQPVSGIWFQRDALDGIDVSAEAELIRQKKSKLSAARRRRVMQIYENLQKNAHQG
jgi:hypothetical protein